MIKSKDIFETGGFINHWFENRIANNKNVILAFTGATGCLSKDTKLYGNEKTLEELYNTNNRFIDTLSLSKAKNKPGSYYFKKTKSEIIPSGKKEVYEIELENGKKVIATSEHKFFKQDKCAIKEVELKDLKVGDNIKDFELSYIEKYYSRNRDYSRNKISKNFIYSKDYLKCQSPFYFDKGVGKSNKKI